MTEDESDDLPTDSDDSDYVSGDEFIEFLD